MGAEIVVIADKQGSSANQSQQTDNRVNPNFSAMPGYSGEWGGDIWSTFKVVEKTDVWLHGGHSYQGPEQVEASPTEYQAPELFRWAPVPLCVCPRLAGSRVTENTRCRLPVGLAVVLPRSLDRGKVVCAAQHLLSAFPIIGARSELVKLAACHWSVIAPPGSGLSCLQVRGEARRSSVLPAYTAELWLELRNLGWIDCR